jgi:hypothetical protein
VVYQQLEELLPIVPDDWGLVTTTGEQLSWIPMDELLVESLELTKVPLTASSPTVSCRDRHS